MPRPLRNTALRRMAQAAIVAAAGAAPVIAAGQASALSLPAPPAADGLTQLDDAAVGNTLDDASGTVSDLANGVGGEVVERAMPVAAPLLQRVAEETTHTSGTLVHGVATQLAQLGPSPDELERTLPSLENPDMHALSLM